MWCARQRYIYALWLLFRDKTQADSNCLKSSSEFVTMHSYIAALKGAAGAINQWADRYFI